MTGAFTRNQTRRSVALYWRFRGCSLFFSRAGELFVGLAKRLYTMFPIKDLIVGVSEKIKNIHKIITAVSDTHTSILVSGESGAGKTLAAMTVYQTSNRAHESLLQFDCAATSGRFMEIELFGIEKDSNLSTDRTKKGLFESASEFSVLLENIDQTPSGLQTKLLSLIQERKFKRIGGKKEIPIKCRIICTSVRNMEEKVLIPTLS